MTDADATTLTVLGTDTAAAADKEKVVGAAYAATVLITATENVHPKAINSSSNAHAPGSSTSTHLNTPTCSGSCPQSQRGITPSENPALDADRYARVATRTPGSLGAKRTKTTEATQTQR